MNDELKEILEYLKNGYYAHGEIYIEEKCKILTKKENHQLLNYITNLQEELEVSQTNEETYRLEMQDITKILGLDEHTIFDDVKEYATNLQQENENLKKQLNCKEIYSNYMPKDTEFIIMSKADYERQELDYKSRCEKAIEYLLNNKLYTFKYDDEELFEITTDKKAKDDLLKILGGEE